MSRLILPQVNRRDLLKLGGGAAAAGAFGASQVGPRSAAAQAGEKSATIYYLGKPYALWTGIRFWTWSGVPARMLFEPLLDIDENLMPAPGLAESWEAVSATLSRYHLRSGLVWSDGTPLTADDIVFSFNLTFNKDLSTLMSTEIATIAGAAEVKAGTATALSGVRAIDDQTIEIETTVPDVSVLRTLAVRWWAPIPRHIYEPIAPVDLLASEAMLQPPVVSGPFKIDRTEPDKWYEMSANTSYWRGKAKLDKVTFAFGNIGDPVALASQGGFDYYIARQPDVAAALADNPDYTVTTVDYIQPYRMQLDCALPRFADPRVRRAVAYAIDRETLANQIYGGNATPQFTDFQGDLLSPDAEVYRYDPDLARQLLSEANWNGDEPVRIEGTAPVAGAPVDPILEAEFAAYQQWFGDVGITLEQRLHPDTATYSDFIRPAQSAPEWEIYENPHRRYDTYGPLEMKIYLASDPANYANWVNADADDLVRRAVAATDPAEYTALAQELSVIVAADVAYVPTKAVKWGIVASNRFTGYTPIGEAYFACMRPYDWDVTS